MKQSPIYIGIALLFSTCQLVRADDTPGLPCWKERQYVTEAMKVAACDTLLVTTLDECAPLCESKSVTDCKTNCSYCFRLNEQKKRLDDACGP